VRFNRRGDNYIDNFRFAGKKTGAGAQKICDTVRLEPDVIAAFPNAEAVNEALRYIIELAKRTNSLAQGSSGLR